MKSPISCVLSIILLTGLSLIVQETQAIPSFARKYKTSCSTCHYAFPKLNGFGKAFKNNGYRYPAGQDLEMTKEEPVSLGADAIKKSGQMQFGRLTLQVHLRSLSMPLGVFTMT